MFSRFMRKGTSSSFRYPHFRRFRSLRTFVPDGARATHRAEKLLRNIAAPLAHGTFLWCPVNRQGKFTFAFAYWAEQTELGWVELLGKASLPNATDICLGHILLDQSKRRDTAGTSESLLRLTTGGRWGKESYVALSRVEGFQDGMLGEIESFYTPPRMTAGEVLLLRPLGVLTNSGTGMKSLLWGAPGGEPVLWEGITVCHQLSKVEPLAIESSGAFVRDGKEYSSAFLWAGMIANFEQLQRQSLFADLDGIL